MQVVVITRADTAQALRNHDAGSGAADVRAVIDELGLSLESVHPDASDPALRAHFIVEVPDAATAQAAVAQLGRLTSVDAAYLKSADEPP